MVEFDEVALARVLAAHQQGVLRTPMVQETQLPLSDLSPEVFERVVVEFAWFVEGLRNVHLYGRRGQKQHGLDVVGTARDDVTVVYQAKRFQTITFQQILDAVELYAGKPDTDSGDLPLRQFAAGRFVLVTSASIDVDTALTDELHNLGQQYRGYGIEIDVYGAEHLSRALRDASGLVHAVFGPEWARALCGVEAPPQAAGVPSPFGLLEDPLDELDLSGAPDRARQLAAEAPELAANLLTSVASELRSAGYSGHADMLVREAAAILINGEYLAAAFDITWPIDLSQLLQGSAHGPGNLREWREPLAGDAPRTARLEILNALTGWYNCEIDLVGIVDGLDVLRSTEDADYGILACVAMEQALADGMFLTNPAASWTGTPMPDNATDLLDRLVKHADHAIMVTRDKTWRCRQRCAVADASLDRQHQEGAADVAGAYGRIVADAGAGRMPPRASSCPCTLRPCLRGRSRRQLCGRPVAPQLHRVDPGGIRRRRPQRLVQPRADSTPVRDSKPDPDFKHCCWHTRPAKLSGRWPRRVLWGARGSAGGQPTWCDPGYPSQHPR